MISPETEQDKQRWRKAYKLLDGKTRKEIRNWLDRQDEDYRADMARRLNKVVENRKTRKWLSD